MSPNHAVGPPDEFRSLMDEHAGPFVALSDHPELKPVVSLALDTVVSSFYPQEITADLRTYLERVTAAATVAIYAPIADIARRSRLGAQDTRAARTAAVARQAADTASCVAKVAAELQIRDDASAKTVARDAAVAAELVATSASPGADTAKVAAGVAATVRAAAAAAVQERARAAETVAHAATTAASEVADAADAAAVAIELEVFRAASALQAIALETCYQVAINFAASAAEAVLADGLPD